MCNAMQTFLPALWVQGLARNVRGYLTVIEPSLQTPIPCTPEEGKFHPQKQLLSCFFTWQ